MMKVLDKDNYYRRYEYGYWTPWEKMKLDIDDNPVIPVVWKDRLFLFWLRILKAPIDSKHHVATTKTVGPVNGVTREKSFAECTMTDVKTAAQTDAQTNTQMKVQAVLCWSEYYNGKWQATKTSDINRPIDLGSFALNGFDRSSLHLSAIEEGDTLLVAVNGAGSSQSYKFYNTHSAPLLADYPTTPADAVFRNFGKGVTFRVAYCEFKSVSGGATTETKWDNTVLNKGGAPSTVIAPSYSGPDLMDTAFFYDSPFFFANSRHVFYVKTTETPVPIFSHYDYGFELTTSVKQSALLPPLVLKIDSEVQVKPKPWWHEGPIGPGPDIIDPAPMQRFVTEDVYIKQAIGTTAVVKYGDHQIGPSGAIRDFRNMKIMK